MFNCVHFLYNVASSKELYLVVDNNWNRAGKAGLRYIKQLVKDIRIGVITIEVTCK